MSLPAFLPYLLLAQIGPNPATGNVGDVADELRNRPPREAAAQDAPQSAAPSRLTQCLQRTRQDPQAALDYAQAWRETASETELAQSAHCAGLALVRLQRFDDALRIFDAAREEVVAGNPAYRARLGGMAGHAALAGGDAEAALAQFDSAIIDAIGGADASLAAGLEIDKARALVTLERNEEAVAALERARGADADDPRAWLLSATLSRRMDRLPEAQAQIEQAVLLAPQDPAIGLEAGVIAALSGRTMQARQSFESVIAVAPESDEATRARKYLEQLTPDEPAP